MRAKNTIQGRGRRATPLHRNTQGSCSHHTGFSQKFLYISPSFVSRMQKTLFIWRELLTLFKGFMGFYRAERERPQSLGYHPTALQALAVQHEMWACFPEGQDWPGGLALLRGKFQGEVRSQFKGPAIPISMNDTVHSCSWCLAGGSRVPVSSGVTSQGVIMT